VDFERWKGGGQKKTFDTATPERKTQRPSVFMLEGGDNLTGLPRRKFDRENIRSGLARKTIAKCVRLGVRKKETTPEWRFP